MDYLDSDRMNLIAVVDESGNESVVIELVDKDDVREFALRENLEREFDIAVLMRDRKTRREAESYLESGTSVFETLEDWILSMGECADQMAEDFETDKEGLKQKAIDGEIVGINIVEMLGKKYLVEYCY